MQQIMTFKDKRFGRHEANLGDLSIRGGITDTNASAIFGPLAQAIDFNGLRWPEHGCDRERIHVEGQGIGSDVGPQDESHASNIH